MFRSTDSKITPSGNPVSTLAKTPSQRKMLYAGRNDFKSEIEDGSLIIDKSLLIKQMIDDRSQVKLIIRPPQFGKTMNMSMLRYFFEKINDETMAKSNRELFKDLKISEAGDTYLHEQGQYPVIAMTFSNVDLNSNATPCDAFKFLISDLYKKHKRFLLNSLLKDNLAEKTLYQKIIDQESDPSETSNALRKMISYLHAAHGKPVIVLIDEYDKPIYTIRNIHQKDEKEIVSFTREVLSCLENNPEVHFAVLTGLFPERALPTNTAIFSMLSDSYSSQFGMTESEIKSLLKHYSIDEKAFSSVEDWFGGYQIGRNTMYHTLGVANFLVNNAERPSNNLQFSPQFVPASAGKKILGTLISKAGIQVKRDFDQLINNLPITKKLDIQAVATSIDSFPEGDERRQTVLWSFLVLTGHLTFRPSEIKEDGTQSEYQLIIPNRALLNFYRQFIPTCFPESQSSVSIAPHAAFSSPAICQRTISIPSARVLRP